MHTYMFQYVSVVFISFFDSSNEISDQKQQDEDGNNIHTFFFFFFFLVILPLKKNHKLQVNTSFPDFLSDNVI